jgi:hypothetical protein
MICHIWMHSHLAQDVHLMLQIWKFKQIKNIKVDIVKYYHNVNKNKTIFAHNDFLHCEKCQLVALFFSICIFGKVNALF